MPINPKRVVDRVLSRIANSEYSLTVHYPKATVKPSGTGAIALPVSPLMAKPNPQTVPDIDESEPVDGPVTVKCLFTEAALLRQTMHEHRLAEVVGWSRQSTALARVAQADAEVPNNRTIFDGADHVVVNGAKYRVLNVIKVASGMSTNGTYYINLSGYVGFTE